MKLSNALFFLVVLLALLPGCFSRVTYNSSHDARRQTISVIQPFKMKIEGVECKFCAHEAEEALLSMKCFYGVSFVPFMQNYEEGYLLCNLAKGGKNIEVSDVALTLEKKGFKLTFCQGQYIGSFVSRDEVKVFSLYGTEINLLLSDNPDNYKAISDAYFDQIAKDGVRRVQGKIAHDVSIGWWIYLY